MFLVFYFRSEYLFNFDEAFEIHDDIEVLKRMGLSYGLEKGECTDQNLQIARNMVPKSLEPYVTRKFNFFCVLQVLYCLVELHLLEFLSFKHLLSLNDFFSIARFGNNNEKSL